LEENVSLTWDGLRGFDQLHLEGGKGDRICPRPMGIENSNIGHFQVLGQWEM